MHTKAIEALKRMGVTYTELADRIGSTPREVHHTLNSRSGRASFAFLRLQYVLRHDYNIQLEPFESEMYEIAKNKFNAWVRKSNREEVDVQGIANTVYNLGRNLSEQKAKPVSVFSIRKPRPIDIRRKG